MVDSISEIGDIENQLVEQSDKKYFQLMKKAGSIPAFLVFIYFCSSKLKKADYYFSHM